MTTSTPSKTSTGGLIAAWIMTVLSLITLINVYNREHRLDWTLIMGYAGGAGALFWRAYRPPMSFGRGVLTWFGGMIAGVGVGFVLYFMFQATGPSVGMRALNAGGILAICLAAGWGLLKLGSSSSVAGPATATKASTLELELRARLQALRPVTTEAIEEALKSAHLIGGSHWINRTLRAQGTCTDVCRMADKINASYQARGMIKSIAWQNLGPLASRNLDHVWLLFVTSSPAVPFLVLRTGDDAYWFTHFPPGQ